jgi:hypothetical protein
MPAIGQTVVGERRAEQKSAEALRPDQQRHGQQRTDLQRQAASYETAAEEAALQGDLETSARLILQALDCERRAGGVGPQVLQLIKPRN